MGHEEDVTVDHAYRDESLLAVVLPVIEKFNGERVFEHPLCNIEAGAVLGVIVLRLGLIPCEFQTRRLLVISSHVKRPEGMILPNSGYCAASRGSGRATSGSERSASETGTGRPRPQLSTTASRSR
jgi:hypothetical protein